MSKESGIWPSVVHVLFYDYFWFLSTLHLFFFLNIIKTPPYCESSKVHVACRQGTNRSSARSATQKQHIHVCVLCCCAQLQRAPNCYSSPCFSSHRLLPSPSLSLLTSSSQSSRDRDNFIPKTYTWRVALKERIFLFKKVYIHYII